MCKGVAGSRRCLFVLLSLPAALAAQPTSQPAPTSEQLHQLFSDGEYQQTLKGVTRALGMKGADATGYDRHDMLMLKADCLLKLKNRSEALQTVQQANKEADKNSALDARAQAIAMELLIRSSPKDVYIPRNSEDRTGIDITDLTRRKDAFAALFTDEMAMLRLDALEAHRELDLPTLKKSAAQMTVVAATERAATGAIEQSKPAGDRLARWVNRIVDESLDAFGKHLDRVVANVKSVVRERKRKKQSIDNSVLTAEDARTAQEIGSTCRQLPDALLEVDQALARPLMLDIQKHAARAAKLRDRAETILTRPVDAR